MRPLLRFVSLGLAMVSLALVGSTSVLAASTPSSASLDASFCIQNGARTYCYDINGTMRFLDTAAGSSIQFSKVTNTTAYENGVEVGRAISATSGHTVFQADGTAVIQSVVNTHSTLGDEPCQYRLVIRLVDYEAVVLHEENGCL